MATRYTKPTISGFNANPPSDDGQQVPSNEITWAKHLGKIGNPLKTYIDAINDRVKTALDTDSPWWPDEGGETGISDNKYPPGHYLRYSGSLPDGVTDNTTDFANTLSSAIATNRQAIFPKGTGAYKIDATTVPSNSYAVFEAGAVVEANSGFGANDRLLSFDSKSNIYWVCTGATFQMLKADYTTGEQRHVFYLVDCTDVTIIDPTANDSGGDGYYINGATDLTLVRPKADNNRRQGMSIIKGTRVKVIAPRMTGTTGTAPEAGIDIEPNGPTDVLTDIEIISPVCEGNAGDGIALFLDDYKTGSPADISITISNPVTRNNGDRGYRVAHCFLNSGSYGGYINIINPVSDGDGQSGISIADVSVNGPFLKISNPTLINPCTGATSQPNTNGVYIVDTGNTVTGGIHIDNLSINATHTDMDYGVFVESGGGFTDLRVSIDNIQGAQTQPVRWNNLSDTIADASEATIDTSRLRETLDRTSGLNVGGEHAGVIMTNNGAAGTVTFALEDYLPPGNFYRFRVEENQTLAIDVLDASDVIVGTTAAGQTVTSNVIGEMVEVSFVGTIGGTRYWRVNHLGTEANWTYN